MIAVKRYYITDRRGCHDVVACIERAVLSGVDYIQVREKDLSGRELLALTRRALELARGSRTRILVNGRVDVAMAAGAHGVHLPSGSVLPERWRRVVADGFVIAVSCHSIEDFGEVDAADFAVFGPVYGSPGKGPAVGVDGLRAAVQVSPVPVFALGGVDESNAVACMEAGAEGIAAIRMFQRD